MHYQLTDPFQRVVEAAMQRKEAETDPRAFLNSLDDNDPWSRVVKASFLRESERTKDLSNSYVSYLSDCQRAGLTPLTFDDWIKTLDKKFIFEHPDWDGEE